MCTLRDEPSGLTLPRLEATVVVDEAVGSEDVSAAKYLADKHRRQLGFVRRAAFLEAAADSWLFVARLAGVVVGFVRIRHRRDNVTVVYEVCCDVGYRGQGVGRAMINRVAQAARAHGSRAIELKCPVDLMANEFYAAVGFTRVDIAAGRKRPLSIWRLQL